VANNYPIGSLGKENCPRTFIFFTRCPLAIDCPRVYDFTATFVGLDGPGTSQIVFRLTTDSPPSDSLALPTPGVAYSQFLQEKSTLRIYDCGGLGRYHEQWSCYVHKSDAVVFVIDRSEKERLGRAGAELVEIGKGHRYARGDQ
jgi:GTPase SAR1 family protein